MRHERRFDDRVDEYVTHRPSYDRDTVDFVLRALALRSGTTVADLGSGTGIFSALLLERGVQVHAVEPNENMRAAAERSLSKSRGFHSVSGSAERTSLPPHCVDAVVAAQAFHWFDPELARREVARIVRPRAADANVALIWNARREVGTPFLEGYEALLREESVDYMQVKHQGLASPEKLHAFFGRTPAVHRGSAGQKLDWLGLRGRAASSSYVPMPGHPRHDAFFAALRTLFERTAQDGVVHFEYEVQVYTAWIEPALTPS